MDQDGHSKHLRGWFERSLSFEALDYEAVRTNLIDIVENHGFKITNQNKSRDWIKLDAVYGSRIAALIFGSIPFVGQVVLWGKRLGLKASLYRRETIDLNIDITPYMELFNTAEIYPLSQSAEEKAADEYLAARKLHSITQAIYTRLNLPLPPELSRFDLKQFLSDTLLGYLICPFDSHRSKKPVHYPIQKGPRWSWGAFLIPEFWYIWHEIWGISILFVLVELGGGIKLLTLGVPMVTIGGILLTLRIISGSIGHKIYYCKYGKWLGKQDRKEKTVTVNMPPKGSKTAEHQDAATAEQNSGGVKPLNKGEEWLRKGQFWPRKWRPRP